MTYSVIVAMNGRVQFKILTKLRRYGTVRTFLHTSNLCPVNVKDFYKYLCIEG